MRARIFEADGTPREVNGSTDDFVVATSGNNIQPAIAALPNGNWAVAYTDSGWADEDVGITLTIMGPDGEVVNAFEHVNVPGDPYERIRPRHHGARQRLHRRLLDLSARSGADDDIYCRIFDQDGNPITVDGFGP